MPTVIVASILGVPAGDQGMFCDWLVKIVETAGVDPKGAVKANQELYAYLGVLRGAAVRTTRTTSCRSCSTRRSRTDRSPVRSVSASPRCCRGNRHDCEHTRHGAVAPRPRPSTPTRATQPARRLLGTAVEEFLRAYSPVSIARIVTTEVTVGECPIARDDMVLLSLPSANRDDRKYEDADKIVLDRAINPHVAFGPASTGASARTSRGWSSRGARGVLRRSSGVPARRSRRRHVEAGSDPRPARVRTRIRITL